MSKAPRRGWSDVYPGTGIRRDHRVSCAASRTKRRSNRCDCPFTFTITWPDRQRRYTATGQTLADAKREKAELTEQARAARTTPSAEPAAAPTVYDFARSWLTRTKSKQHSISTYAQREASYRLRIHDHFGAHRLDDVSQPQVEDWIWTLWGAEVAADGKGARAVEVALKTSSEMLNDAVARGELAANPIPASLKRKVANALPVSESAPPREALTEQEYGALLTACESREEQVMVRLAVETALRRGELAALRFSSLDLHRGEIDVRASRIEARGGPRIHPPKDRARRTVSMSDDLTALLRAHRADAFARPVVHTDPPLFPGRGPRGQSWKETKLGSNHPISPSVLGRRLGNIVERAKLDGVDGLARLTLTRLRKTGATVTSDGDVPVSAIAESMGHEDDYVTRRHYVRAQPRVRHEVAEFWDRFHAPKTEPTVQPIGHE